MKYPQIPSLVVVTKASENIRFCIDPKPLNKALKRNHYPTQNIDDIIPDMNTRVFTMLDTKNRFWHVELTESSMLTTFGTPRGGFVLQYLPFEVSPAPQEFRMRLDQGLNKVKAIYYDILLYSCGENDDTAR